LDARSDVDNVSIHIVIFCQAETCVQPNLDMDLAGARLHDSIRFQRALHSDCALNSAFRVIENGHNGVADGFNHAPTRSTDYGKENVVVTLHHRQTLNVAEFFKVGSGSLDVA